MTKTLQCKRVVTFVPADQADEFAKTIAADIPHLFGDYDSVCWWSSPKTEHGTEQYRPLKGERAGEREGKIEQTPSVRMEFSLPDDQAALETFTARLKTIHPWQQPVIFIFDAATLKN